MNSIERVQAAIELRPPDRVPVDLHNFQPAAKAMGISMAEVFQNGELLAEAMLRAWRKFGHDMILLENGTACNAQACGVEVIYRDDSAPAAHIPVITRLEDVDKLKVPDPYTAFPMCEIIKATKILSREIGDQVWICGRADQGPMDLAAQLRGMQEIMVDIAERVKKVVAEQIKVDLSKIKDDSDFVKDLGAESIQSLQLVAAFEEEFGIEMDEEAALQVKNVGDAVDFISKLVK